VVRVLLVDDDPVARHSVKSSLLGAGYDVVSASSGGIALRHFQDSPVDVLIANVYMAEGDGLKVIAELNRMHSDLGIIALSPSPVPQGYLSAAKAFGASQIFMKPFDVANLIEAVRGLVRG
jgi:two-component system KDP operon response regulator KdpE